MPKQTKRTEWQKNALRLLRGGNTVPAAFLGRLKPDLKRMIAARFKEKNSVAQQAARHWSQIQPVKPVGKERQVALAMNGLLDIHKKLAKRKLAAPRVASEMGGVLAGHFVVKAVPPFDFADTIPTVDYGNPALDGFGNKYNGQLSSSAITDTQTPSAGSMFTATGVYFKPMMAGTLQVSASPTFSFAWWTNSLSDYSPVVSWESGALVVYGLPPGGPPSGLAAAELDEETTSQVIFDFGSPPSTPVSVQLDVDPSMEYMLFVTGLGSRGGAGLALGLAG